MAELNVSATLKIFVDNPAKMDAVKAAIEQVVKVQKFDEMDVGFGIKALKAYVLMADDEGGMDKLESQIKEIDGVSQMEVEEVGRI
ncbi:MAG: elongation factor 1-beta [Candidatus Micrarchaeota archaeon]